MAKATLDGFRHIANIHCSSTSVQDILRYDDHEMSEPLVFGLGAGLGFFYFDDNRYSPSKRLNGRADDLEGKFFRHFGAPLEWRCKWDPVWMFESIASGRPLIAQTDIAYLPHYQDETGVGIHFPLHGIVIAGMDSANEVAFVADTFSPELLAVSFRSLEAALAGDECPMMRPFNIARAPKVDVALTPKLIAGAIRTAVAEMLNPGRPELGIGAMYRLAADLPRWRLSGDWEWCARFAYQGIEKRGTGGGGFRAMYADFLREAESWIPDLRAIDAETRMRDCAARWSEFALLCKTAFTDRNPSALDAASPIVSHLAVTEEELMRDLADATRAWV